MMTWLPEYQARKFQWLVQKKSTQGKMRKSFVQLVCFKRRRRFTFCDLSQFLLPKHNYAHRILILLTNVGVQAKLNISLLPYVSCAFIQLVVLAPFLQARHMIYIQLFLVSLNEDGVVFHSKASNEVSKILFKKRLITLCVVTQLIVVQLAEAS